MTQGLMWWMTGEKSGIPSVARMRSSTFSGRRASASSTAYCRWNTHSSESGPQRSGPMATSTPEAQDPPKSGLTSHRMRTSGSSR